MSIKLMDLKTKPNGPMFVAYMDIMMGHRNHDVAPLPPPPTQEAPKENEPIMSDADNIETPSIGYLEEQIAITQKTITLMKDDIENKQKDLAHCEECLATLNESYAKLLQEKLSTITGKPAEVKEEAKPKRPSPSKRRVIRVQDRFMFLVATNPSITF